MRVVFMGTPAFAVPTLEALLAGPDTVAGVVCQPDRPAGRGQRLTPPPVKAVAERNAVPVLQPSSFRGGEALEDLKRLEPEVIVVAAYGKILPRAVLDLPRHGCINVHGSLLPKYRGAAPIQAAILHGDAITGITIMKMNERMDAGDILLQRETRIGPKETYGELQERLAAVGAEALMAALEALRRGRLCGRPQDETLMTLAPRIEKADGEIDWTRPAVQIERQVRAFNPWPSAFCFCGGQRLKIHRADVAGDAGQPAGVVIEVSPGLVVACGAEALRLEEVQMEGRQRLPGATFARGARLAPGDRLG